MISYIFKIMLLSAAL